MSAQQKLAKKNRNARQSAIEAVEAFAHSKNLFSGEKLEPVFVSSTKLRYADPFAGVDLVFISDEANGPFTRIFFTMLFGDHFAADSIDGLNSELTEHLKAQGLSIG